MTRRREPLRAAPVVENDAEAPAQSTAPALSTGTTDQGSGHLFSISEAAEATDVSRDTIKRRRAAGRFPGSRRDESGAWLIPLADLLADGLTPNAPAPPDDQGAHQGAAPPAAPAVDDARVRDLESTVRELRARLEERERALSIAEQALRALPAAPPAHQGAAPPRRRWFGRARDI